MTARGTLGLCCVHIAHLMTHLAFYTLPFTLQLCYRSFSILLRATKIQKVQISSHDGFQNFITSKLLNMAPSVSVSWDRVAGILFNY